MNAKRLRNDTCTALYHVFNRVTGGAFLFTDAVKTQFRKFLFLVAAFCGIDVITYAIMTNHFHILVKVLPKNTPVTETVVIERVGVLYGEEEKIHLKNKLAFLRERGKLPEADALIDSYRIRMNDISEFMKALESRMTIYYNNHYDREGTLWQRRFGSVILEEMPNLELLRVVAAYIDLNPVRAKLAVIPSRYGWCGSGDPLFEAGLAHLYPNAKVEERPVLYASYLRRLAARKGHVTLDASGLPDIMEAFFRNVIMTRAKAMGSPAFIASLVGDHPPGGITTFDGGADGPIQTLGRLTRRKKKQQTA